MVEVKEDKEIIKEDIIRAITKLDNCWAHHLDGSDLLINNHQLFSIVFNGVLPLLRDALKRVAKPTRKRCTCNTCGLPHSPGGPCEECHGYWMDEFYKMAEEKLKYEED